MKKEDIYNLLKEKGIWHEITEHGEVYTMEDLAAIDLPYPEADAKNVFVRDEKKKNFYLLTIKANKRVDIKKFQQDYETKRLSFVSENDLMKILQLIPGSVSPFGLLNDEELKVQFFIDTDFLKDDDTIIGVHPNENTATVWLKTKDLIDIIKEHGNTVNRFVIK